MYVYIYIYVYIQLHMYASHCHPHYSPSPILTISPVNRLVSSSWGWNDVPITHHLPSSFDSFQNHVGTPIAGWFLSWNITL